MALSNRDIVRVAIVAILAVALANFLVARVPALSPIRPYVWPGPRG